MSSLPAEELSSLVVVEEVRGRTCLVTVVRFLSKKLMELADVERIGAQLYRLVDDDRCANLLVNFGDVQVVSSYLLGRLLGVHKRISKAKGRVALCQISAQTNPVVYECFTVTGLNKVFDIYATEQEALQTF